MLFNSPEFIVVFLPTAFAAFFIAGLIARDIAMAALILFSLVFYAYTEIWWVLILIGSVIVNIVLGNVLQKRKSTFVLVFAVFLNLLVLGIFKYTDFFIHSINSLTGTSFAQLGIVLPIGISFFTFQQIAYVVDASNNRVEKHGFLEYALFVTFFPQLIAGPIVHHREIIPQLRDWSIWRIGSQNVRIGLVYFSIGLFKKVILADNAAVFATPVFDAAHNGETIYLFEAWAGTLAYTFQIYFDFSGYSDMAIGLARMFGVRLPINFNSPYRATNIIDFWHRWHITLSRFLRDYLYIPIGGRGTGPVVQGRNIMIVMLLGGLWHGAGWTFVIWGGLHGIYLIVNHTWRRLAGKTPANGFAIGWFTRILTFVAVAIAWVFFRAESFGAAKGILAGLFGVNGTVIDILTYNDLGVVGPLLIGLGGQVISDGATLFVGAPVVKWLVMLWCICWFLPNTQYMLGESAEHDLKSDRLARNVIANVSALSSTYVYAVPVFILFIVAFANLLKPSPFLYFQF